jgi:HK97 family phage major capsid protein
MENLLELKQNWGAMEARKRALLATAEGEGRHLSETERLEYTTLFTQASDLEQRVRNRESQSTIRSVFPSGKPGMGFDGAPSGFMASYSPALSAGTRLPEYAGALHSFILSGGKTASADLAVGADGQGGFVIPGSESFTRQRGPNGSYTGPRANAAMYEGTQGSSTTAGGDAVNVPTIQLITPLGLPDLGIFDASMVIPTATDVKIPSQASFGTSALKAESTGTIATFGGQDPSLGQTLVSAFMVGAARIVSWELMQDVPMWQQFVIDDLLNGQRILEGQLLATGTGTNQPLGVFGNTGTGTGTAYELTGAATDGLVLLNSLFDVTSTLKARYQPNASWVMSRATGLAIKKAQMQTNLFAPVATTDADGTERILGRPVFYDANAPSLPTATSAGVTPILFGDFRQGNIIGVRGGAGINIKILDQPLALQGQVAVLAYRRLDSRIRQAEAIQGIKISHS